MEKKTLYEKLIEVGPFVDKYFEVVNATSMTEEYYVDRECSISKFGLSESDLKQPLPKPDNKKHKTVDTVLLVAAIAGVILVVEGLIRLASTSGDFGGMDAAYGIALLVGTFFMRPRITAKYKKELAYYEQQQEKINEYNMAKEKAQEKYRSFVETKDSVINAVREKLKELNLEEEAFLTNDYYLSDDNGYLSMLDYAKKHPTHTTLRGYLKEKREIEEILRAVDRNSSSLDEKYYGYDSNSFEDVLQRDRDARFQHDYEIARQEERSQSEIIKEKMERERKERDEWLKASAEKRETQRREREERDAQRKRERDALSKCSHCVNSAKCSITTKYNSLTCSAYRHI